MQNLAVFDFDKTIVSHDTYQEFLFWLAFESKIRTLFVAPLIPLFGILFLVPKLRLLATNLFSFSVFIGQKHSLFKLKTKFLSEYFQKAKFYPEAIERIEAYISSGTEVLIISGCPSWLLRSALNRIGLQSTKCIGSAQKIYLRAPQTTDYCYGKEKLRMAHSRGFYKFRWVAGYSDSLSDLPLLNRCEDQYLVNTRPKIAAKFNNRLAGQGKCVNWD
jgi:phosphatidylglycerophosphatase C